MQDPAKKKEASYMVGAKTTNQGFDDIFDAPKNVPPPNAAQTSVTPAFTAAPAPPPATSQSALPKSTLSQSGLNPTAKPAEPAILVGSRLDSSHVNTKIDPPKNASAFSDPRQSGVQQSAPQAHTPAPVPAPVQQQQQKPTTTAPAQTTASAADYVQDLRLADECFYTGEAVAGVPQGHGTLTSYSSSHPATTSCTRGASARGRCTARALCRSSTTTSDTPAT